MTSPNTIIADMQAEIDALRKEQKRIQAEAQNKITQIEEHIQSLLCLEHKVGA